MVKKKRLEFRPGLDVRGQKLSVFCEVVGQLDYFQLKNEVFLW
jgi:hypothetical protein